MTTVTDLVFSEFKTQVQDKFLSLQKSELFQIEVDRDKVWELYLAAFPDEYKAEYTCNCCKTFLRKYVGVVAIKNNKLLTLWDDLELDPIFAKVAKVLNKYVRSLPVSSVFFSDSKHCGTDKTRDKVNDITWKHFYFQCDSKYVKADPAAIQGRKRETVQLLKRGLTELTMDSIETVLDLIGQNSLYRGKESETTLFDFKKLKSKFDKLKDDKTKELFCWSQASKHHEALCRIRNTSIGQLLIDLSENMELDKAVTRFEKMVAPSNYKRPTALVTPKMVQAAKDKLAEEGLLDGLDRRFANSTDVDVDNCFFVDRSSEIRDVFDEISQETVVDVKKLSKVDEIPIKEFVLNVVPNAKSIEVLLENQHQSKFVSLLNSDQSPKLFKWDNKFSWSYTGGVADSLRDKVAKLGGRVDGVFRFSQSWNEIEPNKSLMDLHVFMPGCRVPTSGGGPNVSGRRVGWNRRKDSGSGGVQDVDHVDPAKKDFIPVENITFPNIKTMPEGVYTCCIHNWSYRQSGGRGKAEIEFGGQVFEYVYPRTKNHQWITVAEVTLKDGKFSIEHKLPQGSHLNSIEKWGLKTGTFVKVKQAMVSPNYWEGETGNKHYLFFLENCINDESPRPFYNEQLNSKLDLHRKTMEMVASKVKIPESSDQLSGLGFSETQKSSMIVRVEGAFKRNLKVVF